MRLVQISDCHLHADPRARSRAGFPLRQLEAVIEAVNRERPDVVLVTGDVSQDETAASYQLAARTLAKLSAPWFWLAGNHDAPALMAETRELLDELDLDTWRVLLLDTRVGGQPHGELGPERLGRLAERLAEDERPTLLVMHHPPLAVGSAWLDEIGLEDREAFWETLAAFRQVKAIFCGHIHQAFTGYRQLAGSPQRLEERQVAVYGCPSTTDQFLPGAETFAVDEASRPGYRVVDLEAGDLTTWVERVDL
ncbi:phosphodiesterase [Halomonas heilongjiangensis]|uniref:Metallophosphoesterase n=1 Tax=Halomonas heilongjiangensis TaxID=1387883 RepID=A0A2N7TN90_9GAMM|nr:phosphodiesterase [Halomonas heilongjiangensis]PMR69657.1 metallophosphoesterase [Halomonas heilongjiangensis]PXX86993.1 metallophosphoesterase [Halomonas heilongjiangensis]